MQISFAPQSSKLLLFSGFIALMGGNENTRAPANARNDSSALAGAK
jgi:hypothetical protein